MLSSGTSRCHCGRYTVDTASESGGEGERRLTFPWFPPLALDIGRL